MHLLNVLPTHAYKLQWHPIINPQGFIWYQHTIYSYNNFNTSGKSFHKVEKCLWEFWPFFQKRIYDTDAGGEGLAVSIHPNSSKSLLSGWDQDFAGKFFHTKLACLCLYGPCLVHWCIVCCHKAGSMKLYGTNSWETTPHHNPSLLLSSPVAVSIWCKAWMQLLITWLCTVLELIWSHMKFGVR